MFIPKQIYVVRYVGDISSEKRKSDNKIQSSTALGRFHTFIGHKGP
jgi:hypothetical protein